MTIEEIKELIHVVKETGIAELEVQRGDNRVRIRINNSSAVQEYWAYGTPAQAPPVSQRSAGNEPAPVASPPPVAAVAEAVDAGAGTTLIKSPIVGTYYDAPSPGAPPFVKVGDEVQPGQVLCIIESMKLMNEIEAETAGIIADKLVENGRPVEYGEALFALNAH
ncbi:MAG: acetyl-CoA carboxylase biotin carboxyl carrier protein [Bryobacteraceae bacterium]